MRAFGIILLVFGLAYFGSPDGRELLAELSSSSKTVQKAEQSGFDVKQEMSANEPAWTSRCSHEIKVYCPWAHSVGDRKSCLKLNLRDLPEDCSSALISG